MCSTARRWLLAAGLALTATLALPASGTAQLTPADSAAVLLDAARTLESRGQWEAAEALYRLIVERYPTTLAGGSARDRLLAPSPEQYGDGSTALTVWSTLYGAWLGLVVPAALGAEDEEAFGAGLLIGGPSGFFVGRRVGRSNAITEGRASAISLGAWWGAWQGFGWQEAFDIGVSQRCETFEGERFCFSDEDSDEEAFSAMVLGSVAGIVTSALVSRDVDITAGSGTVLSFSPLWGTWFGVAGGILIDLEDDDLLIATLIGGNAGLAVGALMGPGWNVTRSRARLVSIAGVLGGLAGAGLDLLLQPDDSRVAIAIPLVGSVAGLGLGIAATADEGALPGGSGEAGAPLGALLSWADGRLGVGAPIPLPVRIEDPRPGRRGWTTALRAELLRVVF